MKRILPALLIFVLLATTRTLADNLVVRTATDSGPQSLRQLIGKAQDGDVITFELPNGQHSITLKSELFISGKSITIDGRNRMSDTQEYVTIQVQRPGRSQFRVFNIRPGKGRTVTLMHLNLRGGDVSKIRRSHDGGVILAGNTGSLILTHCDVQDGKARRGGGIYAGGRSRIDMLRMENCVVTRNESISKQSNAAGGGVYVSFGKTVIRATRIIDNVSGTHSGGICLHNASGVFVDSDIAGNNAKDALSKEGSFTGPSLFFFNTTLNNAVASVSTPTEATLVRTPASVRPPGVPQQTIHASPTLAREGKPISQLLLLNGVRNPLHL